MLESYQGHKYILCIIDEVTNYMITVPICQSWPEEIGDILIYNVTSRLYNYGSRQCIYVIINKLFIQDI